MNQEKGVALFTKTGSRLSVRSWGTAFLVSVLTTLVTACGGSAPPATSATSTSSAAEPETAKTPIVWSDKLSKEQKAAFMKQSVLPEMSKVFQTANAATYANFSCKTCHGPDYRNPPDFLPKLKLKDGNLTAFAEKPEIAKFMHEKVVPAMATLFGEQPYDPKTKQGFGCAGCHKIEMM